MTYISSEIPQKPTRTLVERIHRLQKEFPPMSTCITLSIFPDAGKTADDYVAVIERLEAYLKNNETFEGLWFNFSEIKNF